MEIWPCKSSQLNFTLTALKSLRFKFLWQKFVLVWAFFWVAVSLFSLIFFKLISLLSAAGKILTGHSYSTKSHFKKYGRSFSIYCFVFLLLFMRVFKCALMYSVLLVFVLFRWYCDRHFWTQRSIKADWSDVTGYSRCRCSQLTFSALSDSCCRTQLRPPL